MNKWLPSGLLGALVLSVCLLGMATPAQGQTNIPETDAPDACNAAKGDRHCKRWYKVGQSKVMVLQDVNFATGSSRLTADSKSILDKDVPKLQSTRRRIVIVGHTDSQGDAAANQRLSENRARAVMNYFAAKGVNPKRMTAEGRGENQPIASNDTTSGRAHNRRIEIELN